MTPETFTQLLASEFPHGFTPDQAAAAARLTHFVADAEGADAFLLRGYAGTGKTTLVGAIVRCLVQLHRPVVLLAPTGRAAKVLSDRASQPAYTIHRIIYRQQTFRGEDTRFDMGYNRLRHAVFIVDEASMIARGLAYTGSPFGSGQLLDDLVRFVHEGEGCRLLLVGDTAQLPPVGEEDSPALQASAMRAYGLRVDEADLTQVVRQSAESGVLSGATRLREYIAQGTSALPRITVSKRGEVRVLPGNELIEALVSAYTEFGPDETIVVTRSNKRAYIYNNGIRARVFDREEEITRGDRVMVVKNNYFWMEQLQAQRQEGDPPLPLNFIANGDTAEVVRLRNVHEMHGFRFADATLRFEDYDDFELECRVLLDTLASEASALTQEESHRLYESVLADYMDVPSQRERMRQVRQDPYYNALQLKFAYAVTCHKAQGGQWSRVFIDQGYLPEDLSMQSYLRWLYTAFTRTTDRLYLVNWPKEQYVEVDDAFSEEA